jgi:YihY family inner membrane protein
MRRPQLGAPLRRTLTRVHETELPFIAAAVAYYTFVSLPPLAVLGIALVSRFGSDALVTQLQTAAERMLTSGLERLVQRALADANSRAAATLGGLVVFLWSGVRLVLAIDIAFSRVYDTDDEKSLVERLQDVVFTLAVIAAGIVVAVFAGGVVANVDLPYLRVVAPVFVAASVAPVLVPLYYVLPNTEIGLREALPGSVLTAGAWGVLQVAFRLYIGAASKFALYGVLGTVIVIITWIYFGAFALLVGAVVNAALSDRLTVQS